jgi:DNA-binding NarL/FixJ family response regulator
MTRFAIRQDGAVRAAFTCADASGTADQRTRPQRTGVATGIITLAVMDDCELVMQGLVEMVASFSDRVRLVDAGGSSPHHGAPGSARGTGRPDLVLFDCYPLGVEDGVLRARPVPATTAGCKVVAYTWETRPDLVTAALRHGYVGYVGKSLPAHPLVEALQQIRDGHRVVSIPRLRKPCAAAEVEWPGAREGLTRRELDIINLIASGCTNAEIAQTLYLGINTVKSYIRSAYRKIGVTSRSQAVLWAVGKGLGTPADRPRR